MNKELLFDKRIVDRNIKKHDISKEEYAKHLSSLPDCIENAEFLDISKYDEDETEKFDDIEDEENDFDSSSEENDTVSATDNPVTDLPPQGSPVSNEEEIDNKQSHTQR